MCNNENNSSNCIADILNVINVLQQNASCCGDNCLDTCDRGFLGCNISTVGCNTRPVMLYTCNNTAWQMPTTKENVNCDDETATCSTVFRVEKIDGNCCTFRVLADNPDETEQATIPYVATNSFFTMNLNCVCALKCLNDTYVECI